MAASLFSIILTLTFAWWIINRVLPKQQRWVSVAFWSALCVWQIIGGHAIFVAIYAALAAWEAREP